MYDTCMSHISFESQYFELLQSEKKIDGWPPGGARDPIEKIHEIAI